MHNKVSKQKVLHFLMDFKLATKKEASESTASLQQQQIGAGKRKRRGHGWSKRRKTSQKKKALSLNELLGEIYYDPTNAASFGSPLRLFTEARKSNSEVNIEQVREWLNAQSPYTLNRDNRLHFPHRKVIVRGLGIQYQADLIDAAGIRFENDGNTFILTMIDCFSRLASAVPIKTKGSKHVAEAVELAFKHLQRAPLKLQTDDGKEFTNHIVQQLLRDYGVNWFSTAQPVKAQIVERFNRTLKSKLQKFYSAEGSLRYVNVLPKIILGYNKAPHSALKGYAPLDVSHENEAIVFEKQYRAYLDKRARKRKFKLGDVVRISAYRPTFFRKTTQQNFTTELFVIVDVIDSNPPTYKLASQDESEVITGIFYEAELQKVIWDGKTTSTAAVD